MNLQIQGIQTFSSSPNVHPEDNRKHQPIVMYFNYWIGLPLIKHVLCYRHQQGTVCA